MVRRYHQKYSFGDNELLWQYLYNHPFPTEGWDFEELLENLEEIFSIDIMMFATCLNIQHAIVTPVVKGLKPDSITLNLYFRYFSSAGVYGIMLNVIITTNAWYSWDQESVLHVDWKSVGKLGCHLKVRI